MKDWCHAPYYNGNTPERETHPHPAIAPPDGTIGDSGTYDDALTDWEIGEVSNPDVHPQAIPEPTALALLALGVAAVALRRRA